MRRLGISAFFVLFACDISRAFVVPTLPTTRMIVSSRLSSRAPRTLEDQDEIWENMPLMKDVLESNKINAGETRTTSTLNVLLQSESIQEIDSQTPAQTAARLAMCGMVSYVMVLHLETLTMQFEAIQAWRYTWPLIGALFVAAPFLVANKQDTTWNNKSVALGTASVLGGVGLLMGGWMDAFCPVWYSSPDLLGTRTGLESDSATLLLLLTVGVMSRMKLSVERIFVFAVLCAQLYEMGSYTFSAWGEWLWSILAVAT